ncbi:MAG: hypothetical protein Q4B26_19885 [Eubacteriales bacterium]|nr:hypothetical protein [Eubacteriales bacterium]
MIRNIIHKDKGEPGTETAIARSDNDQELISITEGILLDVRADKSKIEGIRITIAQLETLGAGVSSLIPALRAVTTTTTFKTDGLYRLANAAVGDTLKEAKNGNYWGALKTSDNKSKFLQIQKADGITAKTSTIMPIDPATMMMAAALFSIEQQLGRIEEIEKDILSFLETEKEAEVEADIETLNDIISKYKNNWDNAHYISSNHKLVLDIQRNARKNMLGYQKKIAQEMNGRQLLVSQQQVKGVLNTLSKKFQYYRLSLVSFAMASLIEVMLSGNFREENILAIKSEIEDAAMLYREEFGKCSRFLEKKSKAAVDTQLIKGIGQAGKAAGNFIGNIPIVKNGPVDELLQNGGKKLQKDAKGLETQAIKQFAVLADPMTGVFTQRLNDLIQIYNKTETIAFDEDNIYLITA